MTDMGMLPELMRAVDVAEGSGLGQKRLSWRTVKPIDWSKRRRTRSHGVPPPRYVGNPAQRMSRHFYGRSRRGRRPFRGRRRLRFRRRSRRGTRSRKMTMMTYKTPRRGLAKFADCATLALGLTLDDNGGFVQTNMLGVRVGAPHKWAEWTQFYDQYRVIKSKITYRLVDIKDRSTSPVVYTCRALSEVQGGNTVRPQPLAAGVIFPTYNCENNSGYHVEANNQANGVPWTMTMTRLARKMMDPEKYQDQWNAVSGDPPEQPVWDLSIHKLQHDFFTGGSETTSAAVEIRRTWLVEFREPKIQI